MKRFLIPAAVMFVVIGGVLLLFMTNLGRIVEKAIETHGSRILGTRVEVESVTIFPNQQRATLTGLTVDNPIGYSDGHALSLGEISVAADFGNGGTISKVIVKQPQIHIEMKGLSSNFHDLRDQAGDYSDHASTEDGSSDPTIIRIRVLDIEGASATMVTDFSDETFEFNLDGLRLTELEGTREQVAVQIARELTGHIAYEAAKQALKEKASQKAGELGDRLKELIDG